MAPKDAKKRMKAEQNKKHKLQTTTDPTPCKTVSNCTPSIHCNCSMQIKIFVGANNHFYLSKSSSLDHCHHPCLKSKAILCGQSNMETDDIDILMLLFSVNVTPTHISQIMEHLKGPDAGAFMPKRVYNMNKKTEELHDFALDSCLIVMMWQKLYQKWKEAISTTFIFYTTILGCTHVLKVVLVMRK